MIHGMRGLATAALATLSTLVVAGPVAAQAAPSQAIAYINPDLKAVAPLIPNTSVRSGSSCNSPDRTDTQQIVDTTTQDVRNVHIDACLRDASGNPIDTTASFETSGVGVIFKCPDADKAKDGSSDGPKTATKTDTLCTHSGFEAANMEYHVRVIATSTGAQTVTFCADANANGCADETVTASTVTINWAPVGGVSAGVAPDDEIPGPLAAFAALLMIAVGAGVAALYGRS